MDGAGDLPDRMGTRLMDKHHLDRSFETTGRICLRESCIDVRRPLQMDTIPVPGLSCDILPWDRGAVPVMDGTGFDVSIDLGYHQPHQWSGKDLCAPV